MSRDRCELCPELGHCRADERPTNRRIPGDPVSTTISDRLISWASLLDDGALRQAERAASMPFVFPHLALMPDAHLGKGATVGSVIPTLRAIIPAAVGVDIGCGMIAVRTQYSLTDLPKDRRRLRED